LSRWIRPVCFNSEALRSRCPLPFRAALDM
jgi:hypothetical protein